jgi:hypothetical protein
MKQFIRKFILFMLPISMFVSGSEYAIRHVPNDYSYKNEYLAKHAQNIEILVLGSSHSFFGINPEYFSRPAFNAAYVSQSLTYDEFIYEKYKDQMRKLKTIVLPISYFSLFTNLEESIEHWRVKNYTIYYHCQYHTDLENSTEFLSTTPTKLFTGIKKYLTGGSYISETTSGFGIDYSNVPQSDLVATGASAAERHTAKNFNLLGENIQILNKLIDLSSEKGVKVILYTPPARKQYIDHLDANQLSAMKTAISHVLQDHSNVEYYDLMRDDRFVDSDFHDADHLNGVGAKKLTEILDRVFNKHIALGNQ